MKVARLLALRTGKPLPQEIYLVLISVGGHSAAGRIIKVKNSKTPSGIDPATFVNVAAKKNCTDLKSMSRLLTVFSQ
jgi:hypothetical protein